MLNSFEFMAAGLRTKAFDENTYKRLLSNTVVDRWYLFEDFVRKYREKCKKEDKKDTKAKGLNADTLFQDFEALATKWSNEPLEQIPTSWNPFKRRPVAPKPEPPSRQAPGASAGSGSARDPAKTTSRTIERNQRLERILKLCVRQRSHVDRGSPSLSG